MYERTGVAPHLLKADVDSAYRRIPIMPSHRWAASIALRLVQHCSFPISAWHNILKIVRHRDDTLISSHLAMPFGAISSVHAWDRVAKLLRKIARVLLKMPLLVYVDDFHGPELPEAVKHAKVCFARVVRALLGVDSLSEDKLQHGNPLDVLGLTFAVNSKGILCKPSREKIDKWMGIIADAIESMLLSPGSASKLAGIVLHILM